MRGMIQRRSSAGQIPLHIRQAPDLNLGSETGCLGEIRVSPPIRSEEYWDSVP
jgi:hypothetical protein